MRILTKDDVKEIFTYQNGKLFWNDDRSSRVKSGDEAGSFDYKGYKQVKIGNYTYKVHRLIFLYHHNHLPITIDHIDGDKSNNNIENLRGATYSQNQCNRSLQKNNTSGIKGVSWSKNKNKWEAYCFINKKKKNLGRYNTKEEAECVVIEYRNNTHGEFANHG